MGAWKGVGSSVKWKGGAVVEAYLSVSPKLHFFFLGVLDTYRSVCKQL